VEFVFTLEQSSQRVEKPVSSLPSHSSEVQATFKRLLAHSPETENVTELESELERKVIGALAQLDSKPTLLVVDDEAVYRNALVGLVSRSAELSQKIDVITASNGDQAMSLCETHHPLLILQDVDLGKNSLNGLEVIAALRQKNFKGHICVHSNRFLPDDNKNAMAAGANFVIPKPMGRAHLLKTLLSSLPANLVVEQRNVISDVLPKIVYIDDSTTFLFGFKRVVEGKAEVQTFKTSTALFKKITEVPEFFENLSLIVTDFYFDPTDPLNGLSLAQKLRELGYKGPLVLASDVELDPLETKNLFVGKISKSSFDWHEIRKFISKV
jgi:CheY-like chemotaxis protein